MENASLLSPSESVSLVSLTNSMKTLLAGTSASDQKLRRDMASVLGQLVSAAKAPNHAVVARAIVHAISDGWGEVEEAKVAAEITALLEVYYA